MNFLKTLNYKRIGSNKDATNPKKKCYSLRVLDMQNRLLRLKLRVFCSKHKSTFHKTRRADNSKIRKIEKRKILKNTQERLCDSSSIKTYTRDIIYEDDEDIERDHCKKCEVLMKEE